MNQRIGRCCDQREKRCGLESAQARAEHDQNAGEPDGNRRPAARANLFAQKDDREDRDQQWRDEEDCNRVCERHRRKAKKEGQVGRHDA